jgi:hypothetical protein
LVLLSCRCSLRGAADGGMQGGHRVCCSGGDARAGQAAAQAGWGFPEGLGERGECTPGGSKICDATVGVVCGDVSPRGTSLVGHCQQAVGGGGADSMRPRVGIGRVAEESSDGAGRDAGHMRDALDADSVAPEDFQVP